MKWSFEIPKNCPFDNVEFMKRDCDFGHLKGIGIKAYVGQNLYRHALLHKAKDTVNIELLKLKLYNHLVEMYHFGNTVKRCRFGVLKGKQFYKNIKDQLVFCD